MVYAVCIYSVPYSYHRVYLETYVYYEASLSMNSRYEQLEERHVRLGLSAAPARVGQKSEVQD